MGMGKKLYCSRCSQLYYALRHSYIVSYGRSDIIVAELRSAQYNSALAEYNRVAI